MGITQIRFGVSQKIGRNSCGESDWDLSAEDTLVFAEIYKKLKDKYPKINFAEFDEKELLIDKSVENMQYKIGCRAGTHNIVVSENGLIKPCIMLPQEYFGRQSIDEYFSFVEDGKSYDYSYCVREYANELCKEGKTLHTVCPHGFI
jgi:MoaA/NifB/PqqE/SkfB family radical SAM enzyme